MRYLSSGGQPIRTVSGGNYMKMDEVRARAKQIGVKVSRRTKKDIIRSIQAQEGNSPCYQNRDVADCGQHDCCWREDCLIC